MDITSQRLLMGASASGGDSYWISYTNVTTASAYFGNNGSTLGFDATDNLILQAFTNSDPGYPGEVSYLYSLSQEGVINWSNRLSYNGSTYNTPASEYLRIALSADGTTLYQRGRARNESTGNYYAYMSSVSSSSGSFSYRTNFYASSFGQASYPIGMVRNSNGDIISGYAGGYIAIFPSGGSAPSTKINEWRLSGNSFGWSYGASYNYRIFDRYSSYLYVVGQYFHPITSNATAIFARVSDTTLTADACAEISTGSYGCGGYSIKFNPVDSKIAISGARNNGSSFNPWFVYFDTSGIAWSYYISTLSVGNYETYVDVDSDGNVYWCFYVSGTALAYILKFNTSGSLLWQRTVSASKELKNFVVYKSGMYVMFDNLVVKLPLDGTLTGTYTATNINVTYATPSVTLTDASSTYTSKTPSTVTQSASMSGVTPSYSLTTPTWSNSFKPIP